MAMEIRRPLKRALPTRLGPPDIYPQDPKQKEDELTSINVKQGYTCAPLVSGPQPLDEFGSAKNANIDAFGVYFSALLSEKHRMNTLKDTQKKKQLVNTKEIWYVHAKTKHAVDNWFRDLANGIKSLGQLGKRIPIFNSKEGMFAQLFESHVPLAKAVWFIKMSAVHAIALSESSSKSKKRQVPDQYQELTTALTKYLKELSVKMFECYQQSQHMQSQLQQTQQSSQLSQQSSSHPNTLLQHQQQQHHGTFSAANSTATTNSILQQPSSKSNSLPTLFPKSSSFLNGSGFHHHHHHLKHYSNGNDKGTSSSSYTSSMLNHQPNFTANLHTSVANLMTSHTASAASLSAASISSLQIMHEEFLPTFNQWQYQTQLARYLYDEGLLDQYDFLCFLSELIEKKRPINDLVVRIICPLILEYVVDFSKSAVLSRRLAHVCAKKLSQSQHNQNAIYILSSILQVICIECPTAMVRHHIVDSKFPSMFQGSPLDHLPCLPSSLPMMDSDLNFELRKSIHDAEREILHRSAMADSKWSCDSSSKEENSKGGLVNRLLLVMDILDRHNFDKIDSINTIEFLYPKIFPSSSSTTTNSSSSGAATSASSTSSTLAQMATVSSSTTSSSLIAATSSATQAASTHNEGKNFNVASNSDISKTNDEHVIKLLCEWATTTQRTGEHRALVVARILEKHQADLQTILVQFLDENAQVNQETPDDKKAFNNLVLLFSELIRCDVFSHYNYMCALISRGMFNDLSKSSAMASDNDTLTCGNGGAAARNPSTSSNSNTNNNNTNNNSKGSLGFSPVSSSSQHKAMDGVKEHGSGIGMLDIDDVDADLGKILQDIKEGQQDEAADILLPDYLASTTPDSKSINESIGISSMIDNNERKVEEKEVKNASSVNNTTTNAGNYINNNNPTANKKNPNEHRHMTFVKHFPVPDDENYMHDNNQRNFLLYGFGKEREENRHVMKKLIKEICKLFHRKVSIDINDASKITKKMANREGFNPETTLHKFEALNHYDQHMITNSLSMTIIEMFTGVSNGQTFLLPTLDSLSFVFDLFTMASNVSGLLELVIPILEELSDIEAQIKLKCPILTHQYTYSIALCIIGMLYRYHSCILLLPKEELTSIFESLHELVVHIPNPGTCSSSAERVIFCYLSDLYSSQSGRIFDKYSGFIQRTKQTLQALQNVPPMSYNSIGNLEQEWNPPYHLNHSNIIVQLKAYQMNDVTGSRSRFVCDSMFFSATANNPDIVNEIAVTCADATSKYPALINEWLLAFQALCCPAQRELKYRQFSSKINISDPQVVNNITIFTAVLVARRCLELDKFILSCAIRAILEPLSSIDKQMAEPSVRLTCHLLLTLFRNRESLMNQSRYSLSSSSTGHNNAFSVQPFPIHGNSTPNYGGLLGSAFSNIGMMQASNNNKDLDGNARSTLCLKYLCDHHLLRSACCNIKTECHITLLKAIRVLAMYTSPSNDLESQIGRVKNENNFDDVSMDGLGGLNKEADNRDGQIDMMNSEYGFNINHINLQTATLHQFAEAILRLLCSQRWLHDKCLSDSEIFTTIDTDKNILLDPKFDVKQSQRLLYMICYNKSPEKQADVGLDDQGSDQVASIVKMFENLDVWSMRLSLLRLQFMFAYCKSISNIQLNDWLDNLAKAVVDFFQKASQENDNQEKEGDESNDSIKPSRANKDNKSSTPVYTNNLVSNINKVWLIEPLLDKLSEPPSTLQSKIIKASAALMESASVRANSLPSLNQTYLSTAAASTKFKERTLSQRGSASTNPSNLASTSLLGFQPFLSLLLSCIKNQDKERETLLTSLNSQLYQAIHEKVDDIGYKQSLQDGLELRLCLIGQMFDTIQRSANLTSDWATLLLLLIMNNLVDPQVDYDLYVSVLDMLAMLIHTAYASDPIEQKEEAKKQYQNLMKKFRKELAALEEKGFIQMKHINPLMPLVRQMTEVITCEPMGSLVDTKGEKVENFYSIDKKKGLKVSELQEVSPWDLIEGHKNPAPLSWPWFGAIRLEQKPLKADENNRLMSWHTHSVRHSTSYFYQKPNLDDGPAAKRSNSEKKPSQSNPLLKSLIEANDESSLLNKSKQQDTTDSVSNKNTDDVVLSELMEDNYIGKEDLLEDYCELPVDLLFDSAPIETMIEDIKAALQAEHTAAMSTRAKLMDTKPPTQSASSILAPMQPQPVAPSPSVANDQTTSNHRSTTPQVSALSALQNHLNATSNSVDSLGGPASVPPPSIAAMSPIVNPHTPEYIPTRPPSNIPKIAPTPPPSMVSTAAGRSMSPMVIARSPMVVGPTPTPPPVPKPKAPRKKRATKKDAAIIDANANIAPMNKNAQTINMIPSTVSAYTNNMDTINHGMPQVPPPQMVVNHAKLLPTQQPPIHQMQQQQQPQGPLIVRRGLHGPQHSQQQLHQQQQQQSQASVYDFQYQPQPPPPQPQPVQPIQQPPTQQPQQQPNNQFAQQQQQSAQQLHMNMQVPPHQHPQQQQPQQHMQQHVSHHQIQYQQTPPPQLQPSQHQVQHPQQQQPQQQHGVVPHPHMQPQQIRMGGHQHPQQPQQSMSFQQMQQQQQHPHPQQQIFAPQQAAGHSRPALTAMLHQKHAAAGNPQTRFQNF